MNGSKFRTSDIMEKITTCTYLTGILRSSWSIHRSTTAHPRTKVANKGLFSISCRQWNMTAWQITSTHWILKPVLCSKEYMRRPKNFSEQSLLLFFREDIPILETFQWPSMRLPRVLKKPLFH
uniref:Uncharacterized protein n=1 Tax=Parascaris equorum TaxID=6256 RepID=A0A914RXD0_PAREQ